MIQKIDSIDDIIFLATMRRSVIVPDSLCFNKPKPAAFMVNLSAAVLNNLVNMGMFVYDSRKMGKQKLRIKYAAKEETEALIRMSMEES